MVKYIFTASRQACLRLKMQTLHYVYLLLIHFILDVGIKQLKWEHCEHVIQPRWMDKYIYRWMEGVTIDAILVFPEFFGWIKCFGNVF